ncbi:putative transferase CAF17 homolog, mitochondrial [Trichoplusia ni]|uniref:Transferase CAF17 homolog, mitochondrial n=1 Tax=Trichoplusia ni TaxID=7111 RepID=A0A7E5W185_TRINI|nr:putative transferase CAF17 homolog, mitochondrial [Trichoplusia ni]
MFMCKVKGLLCKSYFIKPAMRYAHDDCAKVLYPLNSRRLLKIGGADSADFLQGLVTNDMNHFAEGARSMYAMFLNSKGRILYDTLIHKWEDENAFMIECDHSVLALLRKHLQMYKLKRKVEIGDLSSGFQLWALTVPPTIDLESTTDASDIQHNISMYKDPRLEDLGYRIITTTNVDQFDLKEVFGKDTVLENDETGYKYLRYKLGVSEGADDLFPGASLPLEANCDYLHGVSFHKGCYIGQELLARVYHTGVVRKRIMPIKFVNVNSVDGLERDAEIISVDDGTSNVGKLKSYAFNCGLGLVRIKEALAAQTLCVGPHTIEIVKPAWWPAEAPKEKVKPTTTSQEDEEAVNENVYI